MRISDWSSDVCSSDLGDPFLQNIHGYLESLAAETGETALLAVREHAAVIYVDVVESSSPIRYSAKVGDRRSLFTASSGKAILTSLAPKERAAILGSDADRKSTRLNSRH